MLCFYVSDERTRRRAAWILRATMCNSFSDGVDRADRSAKSVSAGRIPSNVCQFLSKLSMTATASAKKAARGKSPGRLHFGLGPRCVRR
jgi:hypothetical protein